MKALILLAAGAGLLAGGPALAAADWTVKSPIKVEPLAIPDMDGTIVRMVPGASSGRQAQPISIAAAPACACPQKGAKPRLERRKS